MTNRKSTKRALLTSCMSLLLCFAMLLGTTFAWFTDSASTSVNKIQAGNLKVVLEYSTDGVNWSNAEGKTLKFMKAEGGEDEKVLWEPGCTYNLPLIRVRNNGNLALKYELVVTGVDGDADLLKAIEWTGNGDPLTTFSGTLKAKGTTGEDTSEEIQITGHMKEEAGNEYQDLSIEGIGITVYATQLASEYDSFSNTYDETAGLPWDGTTPAEKPESVVIDDENKTVTLNDSQAFAYLGNLRKELVDNHGGNIWKWTVELNADVDLSNKLWTPVALTGYKAFNGNGHTISNIRVEQNSDEVGLFASVTNNDDGSTIISNLNLVNVYVKGSQKVGALAGYGGQLTANNVTVKNATLIGTKYVGGIIGHSGTIKNSTVSDSTITIPEDGVKEAGGLAGYIPNDGGSAAVIKEISGNTVKNTVISAPTVASGLVSQTSASSNDIIFSDNKLENVKIITEDNTAALYVSSTNGGHSTIIKDTNTASECELVKMAVVSEAAELKEAFSNGGAIALSNDITLTEGLNIENGKEVTLNLNGHKINYKPSTQGSAITNYGELTISGEGGISLVFKGEVNNGKAVNTIENRGTLIINGGEISNTGVGDQIGYAIDNRNGANLTINGGKITASGSTYYDAIRLMCGSNETTVTVNGGTISSIWAQNPSADKATEVKGTVIINGGTVSNTYYENYTTVKVAMGVTATVTPYGAGSNNTTSATKDNYTVYSFNH